MVARQVRAWYPKRRRIPPASNDDVEMRHTPRDSPSRPSETVLENTAAGTSEGLDKTITLKNPKTGTDPWATAGAPRDDAAASFIRL